MPKAYSRPPGETFWFMANRSAYRTVFTKYRKSSQLVCWAMFSTFISVFMVHLTSGWSIRRIRFESGIEMQAVARFPGCVLLRASSCCDRSPSLPLLASRSVINCLLIWRRTDHIEWGKRQVQWHKCNMSVKSETVKRTCCGRSLRANRFSRRREKSVNEGESKVAMHL